MGKMKEQMPKENFDFNINIGKCLFNQRRMLGISQETVASKISMVRQGVSELELGNRNCTLYNFYLLIHELNISEKTVIELLFDRKFLPK